METMNTEQVAELLSVTYNSFLKNKSRYEAKLTKLGCVFTTEGKGKNTLYHFTEIKAEVYQMKMAKNWEKKFGFKAQRPYVAITYYYYLTHEPMAAAKTDAEAAFELLGSKELRPLISMARKDLEKAGYIKPLKATEHEYRLSTPDGMITGEEAKTLWYGAWHHFYQTLEIEAEFIATFDEAFETGYSDKEIKDTAGFKAWAEMKEEWGTPSRMKRRELTDKEFPV